MASSSRGPNPTGINQYGAKLPSSDEELHTALMTYHRENLTDNQKIAARLAKEHGIHMSKTPSASTVKRRRRELGLSASRVNRKNMSEGTMEQLVVKQLDKDPAGHQGVRSIWQRIAFEDGIHIPRAFVSESMHRHDPDGFDAREPTAKKIHRSPKVPIGIHERWSGDGHDKLNKMGFPVYAIVDDATGKWLGAWVVPSNRLGYIVAYLFLCVVEEYEGIPLQFTTDCGSETTQLCGLMNALREIFHPEFDNRELPAHVYLRSIHNITVERSWLRLRLDWGDDMYIFWSRGITDGIYHPEDPDEAELAKWLWSTLLRKELKVQMAFRNGTRMRKNKKKAGPSGMSRNDAFSLPESWGGRDCLLPVDVAVIREIKEAMGGDAILDFVSADYAAHAQEVYDSLNVSELTAENAWDVFADMKAVMYD